MNGVTTTKEAIELPELPSGASFSLPPQFFPREINEKALASFDWCGKSYLIVYWAEAWYKVPVLEIKKAF